MAESALQVHIWYPYSECQYEVGFIGSTQHFAGRKRMERKKHGRPKNESNKAIANVLLKSVPDSWRAVHLPLSSSSL